MTIYSFLNLCSLNLLLVSPICSLVTGTQRPPNCFFILIPSLGFSWTELFLPTACFLPLASVLCQGHSLSRPILLWVNFCLPFRSHLQTAGELSFEEAPLAISWHAGAWWCSWPAGETLKTICYENPRTLISARGRDLETPRGQTVLMPWENHLHEPLGRCGKSQVCGLHLLQRCCSEALREKDKGISMKEAGTHLCTLLLFLDCFWRGIPRCKTSLSCLNLGARSGSLGQRRD